MRKFLCIQEYKSVHADSRFYKGNTYTPIVETEHHLIFLVEEYRFRFNKNGPFFRFMLKEIKPFKFGR